MSPSAIETQIPSNVLVPRVKEILSNSELSALEFKPIFGDFLDDLIRDGYAVVKGAVPRERADGYGRDFYDLLESL